MRARSAVARAEGSAERGRASAPGRTGAWSELRAPALVACLAVTCYVFALAAPRSARFSRVLGRLFPASADTHWEQALLQRDLVGDPHIGAKLGAPPVTRPGSGRRPIALVVFAGSCSTCAVRTLVDAENVGRSDSRIAVLAVAEGAGGQIDVFRNRYGLTLPIVNDPGGTLAREYHASFTPRVYLTSTSGRLFWLQRSLLFSAGDLRTAIAQLGSQKEVTR